MMQISLDQSPQTSADEAGSALWHALVRAFLSHDKATPQRLADLMASEPENPLGPLIKGYMLLLLARAELVPAAHEALSAGELLLLAQPDKRTALYAKGLRSWLNGDPRAAISAMERILDDNPLDAMAIKLGHGIRFMLGDADGMRRSLARVVSIYTDKVANAGFIRGCYAFALEETGDYAQAEQVGRRAVDIEPTDAWGRHAVAHVFEMTGRAAQGRSWLSDPADWSHCNNFSFHMAWHVALFEIELGRPLAALELYDTAVRAERTDDYRDIANAASLLERLELEGVTVGTRWDELADIAERRVHDRRLVFADLHYLIALLGAGRGPAAMTLVQGLMMTSGESVNGALTETLGAPAAAGLMAFHAGRHAEAVRLLEPVMDRLQPIGGSHAQRDVFEQVYLESLIRSGAAAAQPRLARRLTNRADHNRFASDRLSRILAAKPTGQVVLAALALTPPLQAH
jgi:tetratricopeptide (TPR) repeat protein